MESKDELYHRDADPIQFRAATRIPPRRDGHEPLVSKAATNASLDVSKIPAKATTNAAGVQEPICSFSFLPEKKV